MQRKCWQALGAHQAFRIVFGNWFANKTSFFHAAAYFLKLGGICVLNCWCQFACLVEWNLASHVKVLLANWHHFGMKFWKVEKTPIGIYVVYLVCSAVLSTIPMYGNMLTKYETRYPIVSLTDNDISALPFLVLLVCILTGSLHWWHLHNVKGKRKLKPDAVPTLFSHPVKTLVPRKLPTRVNDSTGRAAASPAKATSVADHDYVTAFALDSTSLDHSFAGSYK